MTFSDNFIVNDCLSDWTRKIKFIKILKWNHISKSSPFKQKYNYLVYSNLCNFQSKCNIQNAFTIFS